MLHQSGSIGITHTCCCQNAYHQSPDKAFAIQTSTIKKSIYNESISVRPTLSARTNSYTQVQFGFNSRSVSPIHVPPRLFS
jgi:hypothetical protein